MEEPKATGIRTWFLWPSIGLLLICLLGWSSNLVTMYLHQDEQADIDGPSELVLVWNIEQVPSIDRYPHRVWHAEVWAPFWLAEYYSFANAPNVGDELYRQGIYLFGWAIYEPAFG